MTTPLDFKALVVAHQNAVCAVAYAVLRDRGRSEEVAQEAFLIAWQKLPGMHPAPSLPGWVCGIARNLARNAARRRKELPMTPHTPEMITANTALDTMISNEASELANRALATLSETEREAVVLYYRGEQSLAEVAAALEISEAAAKKRVLRGREHLRTALVQVETTLRGTRPTAAFTAACVAAAAAMGTSKAHAAKRGRAKWIAGAAALPLIGVGAWWLIHEPAHASTPAAVVTSAPAITTLTRHIDPPAKHTLEARIGEARTQRLAQITPAPTSKPIASPRLGGSPADKTFDFAGSNLLDDPKPLPAREISKLDKRALRDAITSVQPMIRECYLRSGKNVLGTLELVVRLEGEPDVGTVATDARVDGDFSTNTELVECVRETLLSIEMPGMDGGIVDVAYPFVIR